MPLVYQQNINLTTKLGVWHIAEGADFFLRSVPVQTQISHPHKQLQHLAGRYLLKELYPDFPYDLIRIADTRKPFLTNEAYHFSISHCGDYAAVMVSSAQRVGVDIELITAKVANVKHKFLTSKELALLNAIDNPALIPPQAHLLTAAWSIKEALFKWYGLGQVDFKQHLVIEQVVVAPGGAIAHCAFLKNKPTRLEVHFIFLDNNCLAWVVS